ncbi:MAG: thioredoxin domain-containing protein [bacterium]
MKQTLTWVIITLVIVGGFFWYALNNKVPKVDLQSGPGKYDAFAQCLAEKKITMYGAVWCSHCQAQKKEFGSSFKYVNYVECPENTKICSEKGIEGFPTWLNEDGSKKLVGEQSFEKLAEMSGCTLPN